jgi:hypothetical protein
MPLDPERPIETLLRRYAAKRREQGGAPPGLHPVNRRLLQSEVRKEFPLQTKAMPAGFSIFRPAWGWALGAATALLMLSAAVFFIDRGAHEKPVTLAMGEEERYHSTTESRRTAATPPAPGEPVEARKRELDAVAEESLYRGTQVGKEPLLTTSADAPAATPTTAAGQAVDSEAKDLVAMGRVAPTASLTQAVAGDRLGYAVGGVGGGGGFALATTNAPSVGVSFTSEVALRDSVLAEGPTSRAIEVAKAAKLERAPSTVQAGRTAQPLPTIASLDKSKVAALAPQAAASPVLDSFQVEQQGQSLRIVDSDGSVYAGALQLVAPEGEALRELTVRSRQMATTDRQSTAAPARPQAAPAQQQQQQQQQQSFDQNWNFAFKVSGTNRSLKQNVVFTGNLVGPPLGQGLRFANNVALRVENNAPAREFYAGTSLTSNSSVAQTNYFGAAAVLQQNRLDTQYQKQIQQLLQNSISGQAKLSDGRTVEVNALAVPSNQR